VPDVAAVTFEQGWFQLADDLTAAIQVDLSELSEEAGRSPEVRTYSGGRRRTVSRPDDRRALQLSATVVEREGVDQLRAWASAATLLLFREPRGRVVIGVLQNFEVVEYAGANEGFASISLMFETTTDTVAV